MFLQLLALIYVACFVANAYHNRQKAKALKEIAKALTEDANA